MLRGLLLVALSVFSVAACSAEGVAPEHKCDAYFDALEAFKATGNDHFSAEWDALIVASEAVNATIEDESAAHALKMLWELRRARSAATIALGLWAYDPFRKDETPLVEVIKSMHRRGQELAWEMQDIYQQAVQVACLMQHSRRGT